MMMNELAPVRPARAGDVRSVDAILKAMYGAISGPAGERDWDRVRSLYAKGATLLPMSSFVNKEPLLLDVDGWIRSRAPFFRGTPFWEIETGRETKRFGELARVTSAYEGRNDPKGPIVLRGTNLIHLAHHRGRWLITSIAWWNRMSRVPRG